MGKKDEYQFDYLDDDRRFADQVNGALFHGKQVVRPDELEPVDAQSVFLGKEAVLLKMLRLLQIRPGCGEESKSIF